MDIKKIRKQFEANKKALKQKELEQADQADSGDGTDTLQNTVNRLTAAVLKVDEKATVGGHVGNINVSGGIDLSDVPDSTDTASVLATEKYVTDADNVIKSVIKTEAVTEAKAYTDSEIAKIPPGTFKDGVNVSTQSGVADSISEAAAKVQTAKTAAITASFTHSDSGDATLRTAFEAADTAISTAYKAADQVILTDAKADAGAKDAVVTNAYKAADQVILTAAKTYTDGHIPTLPVTMDVTFTDGNTATYKVGN